MTDIHRHGHDDCEYCPTTMGQLHARMLSMTKSLLQHNTDNFQNGKREFSYGLHSRWSSVTRSHVPFPKKNDCLKDPNFCNMWRTVGFLMSFAVVIELCTLVSFIVIIGGGVQRRIAGWQVASGVLLFSAVVQCAGMAIVVCHESNMQNVSRGCS